LPGRSSVPCWKRASRSSLSNQTTQCRAP
jgi:hypothetical protein